MRVVILVWLSAMGCSADEGTDTDGVGDTDPDTDRDAETGDTGSAIFYDCSCSAEGGTGYDVDLKYEISKRGCGSEDTIEADVVAWCEQQTHPTGYNSYQNHEDPCENCVCIAEGPCVTP